MNFENLPLFICEIRTARFFAFFLDKNELSYRLYLKHSWIQTVDSLKKKFSREMAILKAV